VNKWKDPKIEKPEQGKKVLCEHEGDLYVAQRFGDYWFPIPFIDSKYSRYFPPNLWQEINFPNSLSGKLLVKINLKLHDIDELEKKYPDVYVEIVNALLETFKNSLKDNQKINGNKKESV
jgi:hypothetical protein